MTKGTHVGGKQINVVYADTHAGSVLFKDFQTITDKTASNGIDGAKQWLPPRLPRRRSSMPPSAVAETPHRAGARWVNAFGPQYLSVYGHRDEAEATRNAVIGSPETASSRLNLVQAMNSAGTMLAPAFGAYLILGRSVSGTAKAGRILTPAERLARLNKHRNMDIKFPTWSETTTRKHRRSQKPTGNRVRFYPQIVFIDTAAQSYESATEEVNDAKQPVSKT